MAGPVPANAFTDAGRALASRELLEMWVDKAPHRVLFASINSDEVFGPTKMPPGGEVDVRSPSGGKRLGRITKLQGPFAMRLK